MTLAFVCPTIALGRRDARRRCTLKGGKATVNGVAQPRDPPAAAAPSCARPSPATRASRPASRSVAPPFTKDATRHRAAGVGAQAVRLGRPVVAEPAMVHDGRQATACTSSATGAYRQHGVIGVATSTDGKTFTPQPQPVLGALPPAAGTRDRCRDRRRS